MWRCGSQVYRVLAAHNDAARLAAPLAASSGSAPGGSWRAWRLVAALAALGSHWWPLAALGGSQRPLAVPCSPTDGAWRPCRPLAAPAPSPGPGLQRLLRTALLLKNAGEKNKSALKKNRTFALIDNCFTIKTNGNY